MFLALEVPVVDQDGGHCISGAYLEFTVLWDSDTWDELPLFKGSTLPIGQCVLYIPLCAKFHRGYESVTGPSYTA